MAVSWPTEGKVVGPARALCFVSGTEKESAPTVLVGPVASLAMVVSPETGNRLANRPLGGWALANVVIGKCQTVMGGKPGKFPVEEVRRSGCVESSHPAVCTAFLDTGGISEDSKESINKR